MNKAELSNMQFAISSSTLEANIWLELNCKFLNTIDTFSKWNNNGVSYPSKLMLLQYKTANSFSGPVIVRFFVIGSDVQCSKLFSIDWLMMS